MQIIADDAAHERIVALGELPLEMEAEHFGVGTETIITGATAQEEKTIRAALVDFWDDFRDEMGWIVAVRADVEPEQYDPEHVTDTPEDADGS